MNKIELLPFLEKILTANSLTEEIRKTALQLRDEIKCEKVFPFNFLNNLVEECDINNCIAKTLYDKKNLKVLGGQINGLSKVQFAMNLQDFYHLTIGQAKELAELLESKGAVQFNSDAKFGCDNQINTLRFEGFVYVVDDLKACIIKAKSCYGNHDKTFSKIGLIKAIREKYGLSLKDAKNLAEYLMDQKMVMSVLNENKATCDLPKVEVGTFYLNGKGFNLKTIKDCVELSIVNGPPKFIGRTTFLSHLQNCFNISHQEAKELFNQLELTGTIMFHN